MTDRAYEPAGANPFDQFDPDKVGALPANQNKKPDDPFEEFNPFPGQGIKAQPDQSSTTGAFARGAERSIVPALGSIPAIGAGAEVGAAVGRGAALGGMELGQEAASGQTPDWTKVAVSTGFGLVFNTPTRIGESLTEIGARPTRTLLGRPQPVPAPTAPPTVQQPTEAPQEAQPATALRPPPPQGAAATLFHAPTVAQASDLTVMGPGVTKEVFEGAHERNPGAAMTAQDAARTETLVTQTTPSLPDIHQVARRMDPDLFDQYQEINQRRNTLQEWVTSEGTENAPVAAGHLATLNGELAELEPKIAAHYRRAAEASGHPTLEPQPTTEA